MDTDKTSSMNWLKQKEKVELLSNEIESLKEK